MNSDLLKGIAAGGAFDVVEAVREMARILSETPLEVLGPVKSPASQEGGKAGGQGKKKSA
jgi:hypothetical protein